MDSDNLIELIINEATKAGCKLANKLEQEEQKPTVNIKKCEKNYDRTPLSSLSNDEFIKICFDKLEREEQEREQEMKRNMLSNILKRMRSKLEQKIERGLLIEFAQLNDILKHFNKLDKNEQEFVGKLLSRYD